jgi:hypothetical protein
MLKDFFGCFWAEFVVGSKGDQRRKDAASGDKLLEVIIEKFLPRKMLVYYLHLINNSKGQPVAKLGKGSI